MKKYYNFSLVQDVPTISIKINDYSDIVTPEYIKEIRTLNNLTQKEFSRILRVRENLLKNWESGEEKIKGRDTLLVYILGTNQNILKSLYTPKIISIKKSKDIL